MLLISVCLCLPWQNDGLVCLTVSLLPRQLTVVDFVMYELLDQHRIFDASLIESHDNLAKFLTHFEELEPVKAYMASDRFMKAPLNNKMAKFGFE